MSSAATYSPSVKDHIIQRALATLERLSRTHPRLSPPVEAESYTCGDPAHNQLILVAGPEQEVARDNLGQTLQFDLHVKIHFPSPNPAVAAPDTRHAALSADIIAALEEPSLFQGVAAVVIGAEEQTFIRSGLSKVYGPWIRLALQYSRRRGQPDRVYDPAGQSSQPPPSPALPSRLEIV